MRYSITEMLERLQWVWPDLPSYMELPLLSRDIEELHVYYLSLPHLQMKRATLVCFHWTSASARKGRAESEVKGAAQLSSACSPSATE